MSIVQPGSDSNTPQDDLDRYITGKMRDPEFAASFTAAESRPAETQQDDGWISDTELQAVADYLRELFGTENDAHPSWWREAARGALAARPSADAEKLADRAEVHYAGMQAARDMPFDWYCPRSEPGRRRRDCPECVAEVALDAAMAVLFGDA